MPEFGKKCGLAAAAALLIFSSNRLGRAGDLNSALFAQAEQPVISALALHQASPPLGGSIALGEGKKATRMLHNGRYKLIYYAAGNCVQLFDLQEDPGEVNDLAGSPTHTGIREDLIQRLQKELYGADTTWVRSGKLAGLPHERYQAMPNRDLNHQRGTHWPVSFPPQDLQSRGWRRD